MESNRSLAALNTQMIRKLLSDHHAGKGGASLNLNGRKAAVLIPLFINDNEWQILYTRRSDVLKDHKGQVSFPGGSIELSDVDEIAAALREANEEIGLDPFQVEILGELDAFETISHFVVKPVVGYINWPINLEPNLSEVSRIFSIPLKWLIQKNNLNTRELTSSDGANHRVIFYRDYLGEKLWGITALITVRLLQILDLLKMDIEGDL